jgi:hypothetical protein
MCVVVLGRCHCHHMASIGFGVLRVCPSIETHSKGPERACERRQDIREKKKRRLKKKTIDGGRTQKQENMF